MRASENFGSGAAAGTGLLRRKKSASRFASGAKIKTAISKRLDENNFTVRQNKNSLAPRYLK
jgi:hypothetical protein